jgi:argininosuccinate lyase
MGAVSRLLLLVKGLPLAYNRDLQEDKEAIFDAYDTVAACLELAAPLVAGAELNRAAIDERLDRGHLDATTLMEYLVRQGVPLRTAHEMTGKLVRTAIERGVRLSDLSVADFQAVHASLDDNVYKVLGVKNAVQAFVSYGSTAPAEVNRQITAWEKRVAAER